MLAGYVVGDGGDIFVVNGYAGTGKTTAVTSLVKALKAHGRQFRLMAPTGRAAKVLAHYTGEKAYTIHKTIYRQASMKDGIGSFTLSPNKDKDTVYIVDEASLIGTDGGGNSIFGSGNLLDDLLSYLRNGMDNKLILIGDSAQLPPVGMDLSPALDMDYISMLGGGEFCELKTVVRQAEESGILYNATIIRNLINSMSPESLHLELKGFSDISAIKGGELIECISDAYSQYGMDETVVLCRSNRRANRYNAGIRATVNFSEERLVRDERLMIVKNCYQFLDGLEDIDFIANGDLARLERIYRYEERYGLHFATAELSLTDYGEAEMTAKVILDTLESETASLGAGQQEMLFQGLNEDYSDTRSKAKRYKLIREDPYYNALQLKYAYAITCHKSQGGQWKCVFIDNMLWNEPTVDDLKWLYTAITRAVEKVYLVNFPEEYYSAD
ncbi:MAG: AAA family ATPase [Muribaculum sp.]|uniref:AAA family ATPase n=2 Tax=Muribaculaceae TaxID=2005473 RepID=A0A9D9NQ43_9BACT|nr:AAA family ATPase [Candidatus Merdivivens faecigallinarum]